MFEIRIQEPRAYRYHHAFCHPTESFKFPEWISPILEEGIVVGFTLTATPTWELVEHLANLEWETTKTTQQGCILVKEWMVAVLSKAAQTITTNYILRETALEESPSGENKTHSLTKRGECVCHATYPGIPQSMNSLEIANHLKAKGEEIVASMTAEQVYQLISL